MVEGQPLKIVPKLKTVLQPTVQRRSGQLGCLRLC